MNYKRSNNSVISAYASANNATPAQAKLALKSMSEDDFNTFITDTFGADDDNDDVIECLPAVVTFNGTITEAVENTNNYARRRDDKGVHGLVTLTVSDITTGSIHTVNCTIAQYGYDELVGDVANVVRGFGLKSAGSKALQFTVEQRVALQTTYRDVDGLVMKHERNGETLIGAKLIADTELVALVNKRENEEQNKEILDLYKSGLPTDVLQSLISARAQIKIATLTK